MEVWSIVFGGRGVGLRAALEPFQTSRHLFGHPFPLSEGRQRG